MTNPLKSFNIYNSYLDGIELLTYDERGRLFTALLLYSSKGEIMELPGSERYVFPLMRSQIDRDREAYFEKSRRNSENGRKGALAKIENDRRRLEGLSQDPPSLEDIKAFCQEQKLSVNPQRFFDYFEAGKWRDSHGNRVYNWRQKIMTWNLYEEALPPESDCGNKNDSLIDMDELKRSIDKI